MSQSREKLNLSELIYKKLLPIYLPSAVSRFHLAIWCCIDIKDSKNLWKVLKGIRITIRKDGNPLMVVKKGCI